MLGSRGVPHKFRDTSPTDSDGAPKLCQHDPNLFQRLSNEILVASASIWQHLSWQHLGSSVVVGGIWQLHSGVGWWGWWGVGVGGLWGQEVNWELICKEELMFRASEA